MFYRVSNGGTVEIPSSITVTGYCEGYSTEVTAPAALCNLYNTLVFSQSGGGYSVLFANSTNIGSLGTYNLANYRGYNMKGHVNYSGDGHGPAYAYLTLSNPVS